MFGSDLILALYPHAVWWRRMGRTLMLPRRLRMRRTGSLLLSGTVGLLLFLFFVIKIRAAVRKS